MACSGGVKTSFQAIPLVTSWKRHRVRTSQPMACSCHAGGSRRPRLRLGVERWRPGKGEGISFIVGLNLKLESSVPVRRPFTVRLESEG
ncbi:hypothetical protein GJAV_G00194240 [Gymnothorax javanicus]|nr:hypothetical protein GJAV_G00194240 [Gymnothorax javanicus]